MPGYCLKGRKTILTIKSSKFFYLILLLAFSVVFASGCKNKEREEYTNNEVQAAEIEKIHENIFISGVDVGGLTKAEAVKKLEEALPDFTGKKIDLACQDVNVRVAYEELDPSYDIEAAVNLAFAYGKGTAEKEKLEALQTTPFEIFPDFSYNKEIVIAKVSEISEAVEKKPVNAQVKRENGEFVITAGTIGYEIQEDKAVELVYAFIEEGKDGTIDIPISEVSPKYTEEDCKKATSLIGTYTTKIAGGAAGRNKNLLTAADKINNKVVYPGEVFSTNAAFGDMTSANGYTLAPVIIGGVLEDGMGGGVCQVSSTLYMALLHAELEITERRNHSLKVGYLPYAYDATLAGDYIDLKFKNDTEYPVFIESYLENGLVVVNIYGHEIHSPGRTLEFYNVMVGSSAPPAEEIVETSDLPLGERKVKTTALTGYTYDLYKIVYEDGKEIERVNVNSSYYKPRRAVVLVGTGPSETNAEMPGENNDNAVPPEKPQEEQVQPEPPSNEQEPELPPVEEAPPVIEQPQEELQNNAPADIDDLRIDEPVMP